MGHFQKAGIPPTRFVAEVPVDSDDESKPGDSVLADIFSADEKVRVVGKSKGRGFQGVIKRHHFGGGRATHGSMHHRAPGSIGRSATPSRVFPGQKMPGHMGDKRITIKNAQIVKVDVERNLLFLKGGVPGARNSYIRIVKT
jgi:large subunit ribosomal protein L3